MEIPVSESQDQPEQLQSFKKSVFSSHGKHLTIVEHYQPTLAELPVLERGPIRTVDPTKAFRFEITDHELGTTREIDQFLPPENLDAKKKNETVVFVFGNTGGTDMHSVTVFVTNYKPYFRFSLRDVSNPNQYLKDLKNEMFKHHKYVFFRIHWDKTCIIYKKPAVGYTDKPWPFLHVECHTTDDLYTVKNWFLGKYPKPTLQDIQSGKWKQLNKHVVCEDSEEATKFIVSNDLISAGWVELKAGTYKELDPSLYNTTYGFSVDQENLVAIDDDEVASKWINSFDIEVIRTKDDGLFPKAEDPTDYITHIGHAFFDTKGYHSPLNIVFTWGDTFASYRQEDVDTLMSKFYMHYQESENNNQVTLYVVRYPDEKTMLENWSKWKSSPAVQADIETGFNIYCFDLGYTAKRMLVIYNSRLSEKAKVWSRLPWKQVTIKESSMQSRAGPFSNKYFTIEPTPGVALVDAWVLVARDVTIRLPSTDLKSVMKHFSVGEKQDLPPQDMKPHFYGTPEMRGKMILYNWNDSRGTAGILLASGYVNKMTQMARLTNIRINDYCLRGQQIRVYGGYMKAAKQENVVLYRPYYHPILDSMIVEELEDELDDSPIPKYRKDDDDDSEDTKLSDSIIRKFSQMAISSNPFASIYNQALSVKSEEDATSRPNVEMHGFYGAHTFEHNVRPIEETKTSETPTKKRPSSDFGLTMDTLASTKKSKGKDNQKGKIKLYSQADFDENEGDTRQQPSRETVKFGNDKSEEKSYSGGFVMSPNEGLEWCVSIIDWNSLYPNIHISFFLDPQTLILEEEYGNRVDLEYVHVRFNREVVFGYVKEQGALIKYSNFLAIIRKAVQEVEGIYGIRIKEETKHLKKVIETQNNIKIENEDQFDAFIKNSNLKEQIYSVSVQKELKKHLLARRFSFEFNLLQEKLATDPSFSNLNVEELGYDPDYWREKISNPFAANNCPKGRNGTINAEVVKNCVSECTRLMRLFMKETSTSQCTVSTMFNAFRDTDPPKELSYFLVKEYQETCFYYKEQRNCFNSKQNGLKETGNSVYGFTAAGRKYTFDEKNDQIRFSGKLPIMPIASCITFLGRICTNKCRDYVESLRDENGKKIYQVLYIDTDSLFIKNLFYCQNNKECFDKAFKDITELCVTLTKQFPGTMRIVLEYVANIIFYKSKCYAFAKKAYPDDIFKMVVKGLPIVKRNTCQFIQDLGNSILKTILIGGSIESAKKLIVDQMIKLINGEIPIPKLAMWEKISKAVTEYKFIPAHVLLAMKMKRETGNGPSSGQSIGYVYVDVSDYEHKKPKIEKICEVSMAIAQCRPIDYHWYISNPIKQVVTTIMSPFLKQGEDLLGRFIAQARDKQLGLVEYE